MFKRAVFGFLISLVASTAFAEEYGACEEKVRWLISKGGTAVPITKISQDRTKLEATYTHEFGDVWTSYSPDNTLTPLTPVEREKAVAEALQEMDEELLAVKRGQMWYLVVNRILFPGLPPLYKDLEDESKVTMWRPYHAFVTNTGECVWGMLDIAVFEQELPLGIRRKLAGTF